MKKTAVWLTAGMIFLTFAGPSQAGDTKAPPAPARKAAIEKKINDPLSLTIPEAKKLLESRKDLQLIDVRSPLEFSQVSLKGSRNVPFIDIMEGRHNLAKDKPILLVCSIGGRSFAAVQVLQEKGYQEVYNLDGGIDAWRRAGLPVELSR
jgi:rhodanese-related sulfurtransferase